MSDFALGGSFYHPPTQLKYRTRNGNYNVVEDTIEQIRRQWRKEQLSFYIVRVQRCVRKYLHLLAESRRRTARVSAFLVELRDSPHVVPAAWKLYGVDGVKRNITSFVTGI